MIRDQRDSDFDLLLDVINDAAEAYRGVIPEDCMHEPYMGADELRREITGGVHFVCFEEGGRIAGVMGIQDRGEVALIRHAYVRTADRRRGIGARLLHHIEEHADKPLLVGTWAAAVWAIDFYRKNGYRLVGGVQKDRLLARYWSIPQRQIAASVVLWDAKRPGAPGVGRVASRRPV